MAADLEQREMRRKAEDSQLALLQETLEAAKAKNHQQLEELKVIEKVPKGKGRQITRIGQQDLDRIASQLKASAD